MLSFEAIDALLKGHSKFVLQPLLLVHLMKNYAGQFHLNKVGVLDDEPGQPEGLIEDHSFKIRGVLNLYREGSDEADRHAEHYL